MANQNPYYLKRTIDRIAQAHNYLMDAMEFLKRGANELNPEICNLCPKEAVYFYGKAQTCEEHASDEIRSATKETVAKMGSPIITPVTEAEAEAARKAK